MTQLLFSLISAFLGSPSASQTAAPITVSTNQVQTTTAPAPSQNGFR